MIVAAFPSLTIVLFNGVTVAIPETEKVLNFSSLLLVYKLTSDSQNTKACCTSNYI